MGWVTLPSWARPKGGGRPRIRGCPICCHSTSQEARPPTAPFPALPLALLCPGAPTPPALPGQAASHATSAGTAACRELPPPLPSSHPALRRGQQQQQPGETPRWGPGGGHCSTLPSPFPGKLNCNELRRVLTGGWTAECRDGTPPTQWLGSAPILRQWAAERCQPVRYGQCWVFAAVACSGTAAAWG